MFVDLRGALRHVIKNPNDVLGLLIENKIDQIGGNHYLFKFGYLLGLIESSIRNFASRSRLSTRLAGQGTGDAGKA